MATTAQGNRRMAEGGMTGDERWWKILRMVGWSLAALLLLIPGVAMLFTDQVNWTASDFFFAALILGGTGLLFEVALRRSADNTYRTGILLGLAATFLLVWSNAAVGFVGSGANVANVLYLAMVAIPLLGGFVVGFKARGMFLTMVLTAVVQAAITGIAYAADLVRAEEGQVILAINAVFILLWVASAVLFHQAAQRDATVVLGTGSGINLLRRSPIQFVLSSLMIAIGTVGLVYMITVENEPGAVPLLVVLLGMAWFFITLFRARSSQEK
jgi:hypothetical protein